MEQGTHEPEAYDFYLRGRGYLQDYHKPENVDSAIAVFQHALERDPNYARAYAGLGESYWRKYEQTHARNWVSLAEGACKRAVDLASDLAIAHNCLGIVSDGTGAYQRAVDEFQRATRLDPSSDSALLGLASAFDKLGRTAEAESFSSGPSICIRSIGRDTPGWERSTSTLPATVKRKSNFAA